VESNIIESNNLGKFYKYVNRRLTYRRDLGALIGTDGAAVVDDEEKATLFNNYFALVGVVDDNATPVCDTVLNSDNEYVYSHEMQIIQIKNKQINKSKHTHTHIQNYATNSSRVKTTKQTTVSTSTHTNEHEHAKIY